MRPLFALLSLLILLALPSAALAQSAGDDQYSDPFGDTGGQSGGDAQGDDDGGTGGGDTGGSTGGDTPVSSEPDTGSAAPDSTSAAPVGAETSQLPRTGFEIVLLLAAAFPLLVAGVAIRRIASEP